MSLASNDIHFRASPAFRLQLAERATQWSVSLHEAARRLSVLAAYRLSADDHGYVAQLANNTGNSFAAAAAALSEISEEMTT